MVSTTKDDITRTLEMLRQEGQQRTAYRTPQQFTNFLPATLGTQPQDVSMWNQNLRGIDTQGDKATELAYVMAQNKQAKQNMLAAKKQQKLQTQQYAAQNQAAQQQYTTGGGGTSTPGPVKGFNPRAPLANYNWHGFSLRLNSSVASRFVGFLNALSAKGYKIKSIGTYANRNIAGTNVQSLHALGLAMDINPSSNPVTYNGHVVTNMPPGVGALAARYGLMWGGAWSGGSKRDPMHFSVPYGGRM